VELAKKAEADKQIAAQKEVEWNKAQKDAYKSDPDNFVQSGKQEPSHKMVRKSESKKVKKDFSNAEILEYSKFKIQDKVQGLAVKEKEKKENDTSNYAIEESSLDEEALKDLTDKAKISQHY